MKKLIRTLILLLIIALPIVILIGVDNYFSEKTDMYLKKEITYQVSNILTKAINNSITTKDLELLKTTKNTDGTIARIYIDASIVNSVLTKANETISSLIEEKQLEKTITNIELPFGMLVSKALFTTIGPNVKIYVEPITSYKTDIQTNITHIGINNSVFEVFLMIEINMETMIPLKSTKVDYKTKVILASELIQGEVPYYYYLGEGSIQSLPL